MRLLRRADGAKLLGELAAERERRIRAADPEFGDPLLHGYELDHWKKADEILAEGVLFLILLGGNRSGKSEYAAKRIVQSAVENSGATLLCLAENIEASNETQQALVWKYLPRHIKALNKKRDRRGVFSVNYKLVDGFHENKLVLPNRTKIIFKTYQQDAADVEGWMFGHKDKLIPAIWPDENLRLPWLQVFDRRLRYQPAQMIWAFTPINGMTPTIKEAVGAAKTLEHRPAELLPATQNVEDCPVGTMPVIQQSALPNSRTMYFWSEFNPFGPSLHAKRTFYDGVKETVAGKSSKIVKQVAYGYCEDTIGKAFPNFCAVHQVKPEHLPATGTNYMITDPAGARRWATIWVRVSEENPPRFYVYRDWPDAATYGEWAIPTAKAVTESSRAGWDGDRGPAQHDTEGLGIIDYKRIFLNAETVGPEELDPYRKALWEAATLNSDPSQLETPPQEAIHRRLIDPRAAANPHVAEHGGTNIVDDFRKVQTDAEGNVVGPRMILRPASGVKEDFGTSSIKSLLSYDRTRELDAVTNYPRLFVSTQCRQLIWALNNYTGRGGPEGACKDFIDLLRYAVLGRLKHIDPTRPRVTGVGSY